MKQKENSIRDDYSNDRDMKLERNGNLVSMKNNVPSEQYKAMIEAYSTAYLDSKKEIDDLVKHIKNTISSCNPLGLLNFMVSMSYLSLMNTTSEIQLEAENNQILRSVEYVQSVLVSSENKYTYNDKIAKDEPEKYEEILNDIIELQNKVYMFYFCWTAHVLSQDEPADNEALQYIVESQLMGSVRGDRYQYYQIEHLRSLIQPHDSIMRELFNVSSVEFFDGLIKLEHSLSSGKGEAFNDFRRVLENFGDLKEDKTESELEAYFESIRDGKMQCVKDVFRYSLYDVKAVTGWSDALINSFSFSLNEYDKFYFEGDFSGWPIIDLPIQKKPFIKIDNINYCFDYYSLFDNIYRVLQKAIKEIKPAYVDTWAQIQQNTSETMVEELMKKILPGCQTYRDNYYPKNNSLKDCAENDILVIFDDVLFIIEVKAGSFVYTPAINDYKAHIKSFQTLIEKADFQCDRTLNYVKAHPTAPIYDREKNKKADLTFADYSEIYTVCVTVDNFNEFASKAEKLSFIKLKSDTIALSIDDLRIYSDILDNPLYFLHYFKQRKTAVQTPQVALNDELDHLGLYLNRNIYTMDAEELDPNAHLFAVGFREDIDNYFASLHNEKLSFDKPSQNIPKRIGEIIDFMNQHNISGRIALSTFLLNYDFEGRQQISDGIDYSLKRQKEIKRMARVVTFGEIRYCLFVYQTEIEKMKEQEKDDYIFATMLTHSEPDRLCINLYYGINNELVQVNFRTYLLTEIPSERKEELKVLGEYLIRSREESYRLKTDKKKVGRNDPCSCGSGKKYKKCCIDIT